MITITKAQRQALKAVYDRGPLILSERYGLTIPSDSDTPLTYRQFRRHVTQGWDCIMLHWCGMWLGIEKDGYTHI